MNGWASALVAVLLVSAAGVGIVLSSGPVAQDPASVLDEQPVQQSDAPREALDVPAWVSAEIRAIIETSLQAGGSAPNPYQEGENGDCTDYNGLYSVSEVQSPLAAIVEVEGNAGYVVDSSSGVAHMDFFNEEGGWLDYSQGVPNGNVPADATYGVLCVALLDSYPDAPEAFATWFYMDGFPRF